MGDGEQQSHWYCWEPNLWNRKITLEILLKEKSKSYVMKLEIRDLLVRAKRAKILAIVNWEGTLGTEGQRIVK